MKPLGLIYNLIKFSARQLAMLITACLIWADANAAESKDLKTFGTQESYVVEGASILLTQKVGEATIKIGPALRATQNASALTAANGAKFSRDKEMPGGIGIYRLEAIAASDAESKAAVDSLNENADVEFAYPVYVNPSTGNRLFLNDEIVVQLKPSSDLHKTDILSRFKLKFADRLPGATNTYVLRLTQPKNFNPFKVCHALRQREDVLWAEPNKTQEFQRLAIPNDTQFGNQWHLRNTSQTGAFSDADIDADDAWDSGYGSPGIRIAILDDGVQTDHPDLTANIVGDQVFDIYINGTLKISNFDIVAAMDGPNTACVYWNIQI